jgi:hypothetical protein
MTDSTACLIRSDALYIDLVFQLLSAAQRDMEEDNPVTRHFKWKMGLVAAWFRLFRLRELGAHARVRHISLDRNVGPRNGPGVGIGQPKSNRLQPDSRWFGRDFVLDCDRGRRLDRLRAASYQQNCYASQPVCS